MSPLLTGRRVVAAKQESTVGTAETLAASDAAFNVFDANIQRQGDFEERKGQGSFSPLPGESGARSGQATFAVELHGSGSPGSPVPAWATTLLPACGMYDDSDVFRLDSRPPEAAGSNTKTLTIGVYEDGILKRIAGAMGTFVMRITAGQIVRLEFTFTGTWVDPQNTALLAPNYPSIAPAVGRSAGLTLGAWTPTWQEMTIDMGNVVVLREDANAVTGYHSVVIANRRIVGTINPEQTLLSVKNNDYDWTNRTERAMAIDVGDGSANGNQIDIAAPKLQITDVQEGDRNGIQIEEVAYQLNRSADAGEDELTITWS